MATDYDSVQITDLQALLDNLPGMVYQSLNTRDWPMEYVSAGAKALSGLSTSALVQGRPHWGEIIHPEDRDRVWATVQEALQNNRRFEVEYRIQTLDKGSRWVLDRGSRVASDHKVHRIEGFVADITEQLEAQERLHAQQARLAQADRLSTLGEMMSGIAHEINQPLTAISGYAQSALRFIDVPDIKRDRLRDALVKMGEQTRRAAAVVERIRELARTRVQKNEAVDCNALLTHIRDVIEPRARTQGSSLVLELTDNLGPVLGDPTQLEQLILNLIRNAIDVTRTHENNAGRQIVLRSAREDDKNIRISVIDQGPGVSDARASELFHPFATHKSSRIELGLAVSRSIAEAHRGKLSYTNNPAGGATFYVTLPLWTVR